MKQLMWRAMSWNPLVKFRKDQSGIGTLEVMLIIAVIVILFIIFREFIVGLIKSLFAGATEDINKYSRYSEPTGSSPKQN